MAFSAHKRVSQGESPGTGIRGEQRPCEKRTERQEGGPMHSAEAADGACSGSREKTQSTEVASQKGSLQSKGLLKTSDSIVYFSCQEMVGRKIILCLNFTLCASQSKQNVLGFFLTGFTVGRVRQKQCSGSPFDQIVLGV